MRKDHSMQILFTARRFRARPEIKEHALAAVRKLERFYDGIMKVEVILSFEGATKNIKVAEVNVHVYGVLLSAKEKADSYYKAIDEVVGKLVMQIERYKSKLRSMDKERVRSIQAKV
jgi:putative sigma-54 modulation protein